ncbi:DUF3526 domain-containing protein [Flavobacteriaceae bacterium F08102]|nr:DUF3526 domain-containing protein [Flavobacteriaceae bacterium F08102]
MIKKTIHKELKELFRDGRIKMASIIVLLLMVTAIWISTNQYNRSNEQYEKAKVAEREVWDNQGEKNPHSAAHYGTYVFKSKQPLSLLDQGVDKYTGTSIFLAAHTRSEAEYSEVADQSELARFGQLSPDFILLYIIPLLIILIGYNSFTKENEMGTMSLLKSQGAVPWKIMIGKWVAIFLPIALMTIVLFVIAGILLSTLDGYTPFKWSSLFVLLLVYLFYYVIFINITLFVSKNVRKSGVSLVLLLGVWIISCLAAPKAASNFAESEYPYPTRQEFENTIAIAKKEGLDGHDPWSDAAKRLEKEVLEEYNVDSLHKLPFNFNGYRMQKGEEHEAAVYKTHYEKLKNQFEKQVDTYITTSVISPFLPTRLLSMGIAGTDYYSHWDFADAAENYRIAAQKFLNDDLAYNTKYGQRNYVADADFWKKLPTFNYQPPGLATIIKQNTFSILVLLAWGLITSALLFNFRTKN